MSELSPCLSCRRHARRGDPQCPFCGARVVRRDPVATFGTMSRAMVFASATLAVAACGGSQKKPNTNADGEKALEEDEHENYQDHPCYDPTPEGIAAAQKKVDEAKTDEERAAAERELERVRTPVCAPYGAPPARRRVV